MNQQPGGLVATSGAMHSVPFDPAAEARVAEYVRSLVDPGAALETRIHPGDEMYRYELSQPHRSPATAAVFYFHTRNLVAQTVERIVRWVSGKRVPLSC